MSDFCDDVTNEVSGTGYTRGGPVMGLKTSGYDVGSRRRSRWARLLDRVFRRRLNVDAADVTWESSTITITLHDYLEDANE